MTCIDSIGAGQTFDAHLGNSRKINDALIADAADWLAQWLVTGDGSLTRSPRALTRCRQLKVVRRKFRNVRRHAPEHLRPLHHELREVLHEPNLITRVDRVRRLSGGLLNRELAEPEA